MMPALSSAAPRPNRRPSRSVGSNGSLSQAVAVADRLDVVVGVEQHGRRAGRRGPAADHGRLPAGPDDLGRRAARPRAAARPPPRRLRSTCAWSNPSNAMPGIRTRFSRSARTPGSCAATAARSCDSVRLMRPIVGGARRRRAGSGQAPRRRSSTRRGRAGSGQAARRRRPSARTDRDGRRRTRTSPGRTARCRTGCCPRPRGRPGSRRPPGRT